MGDRLVKLGWGRRNSITCSMQKETSILKICKFKNEVGIYATRDE